MRRRQRASLGLGLALMCACGAPGTRDGAGPEARDTNHGMAIDFTLESLDGELVSLAQFRGKTVLIDFWATWCPPCIFQVPELNRFWKAHRDDGVVVLGVAIDEEGAEVVGPWIEEQKVEYPILLGDDLLAQQYGAIGFPTLVVVRPDGIIDSLHVGLIEIPDLEAIVERARAASGA